MKLYSFLLLLCTISIHSMQDRSYKTIIDLSNKAQDAQRRQFCNARIREMITGKTWIPVEFYCYASSTFQMMAIEHNQKITLNEMAMQKNPTTKSDF